MRESIKINKINFLNDKTISFNLSYPKQVEKYFSSNTIVIQYEESIKGTEQSILNIPALSSLITVAWAIGTDIYVNEIDKTYLESLNNIKKVLRSWYPHFSFNTKINVEGIVTNNINKKKIKGLLFSTGLDSWTSYIKHRSEKPSLIYVWGAEHQNHSFLDTHYEKLSKKLSEFLYKKNQPLMNIRTNIPQMTNKQFLYKKFRLNWWEQVCHSIVLTGLCSPITYINDIGYLYISSSRSYDSHKLDWPWGSHPLIDNNISWAGTKVIHDNYDLSRQLKIRYLLKDYFHDNNIFLKVCNNHNYILSNCSRCEKCSRTIVGLVSEDIDPSKIGFVINKKTFHHIKKRLVNGEFFSERDRDFYNKLALKAHWKDIQKNIPTKIMYDYHGSKEFLNWYKGINFNDISNNTEIRLLLISLIKTNINRMPKKIKKKINIFLEKLIYKTNKVGSPI